MMPNSEHLKDIIKWMFLLGLGCYGLREGYRARRHTWSRKSWRRFIMLATTLFVLMIGSFGIALLGDRKTMPVFREFSRSEFFFMTLGVGLASEIAIILLIGWFWKGDPEKQIETRREQVDRLRGSAAAWRERLEVVRRADREGR